MSRILTSLKLSILNGATKSNSVQDYFGTPNAGKVGMAHATSITIKAPAALTGVVTIQVAHTNPSVDADFGNVQQAGADLTIAAGKSVTLTHIAATDLRLISGSAEAAQRDFDVSIQEDIG